MLLLQKQAEVGGKKTKFVIQHNQAGLFFNHFFCQLRHFTGQREFFTDIRQRIIPDMELVFQPVQHKINVIDKFIQQICGCNMKIHIVCNAVQNLHHQFGNFLTDPALDSLYTELTSVGGGEAAAEPEAAVKEKKNVTKMLPEGIKLGLPSVSKEEAIQAAGELLKELGCVGDAYISAMQEREKLVSTYMGLGVAIPHGTSQAKGEVMKSGIVFLQYPDGVDFGDEKAQLVFGIAGVGDEHLDLLSNISNALEDEELLEALKTTTDINLVLKKFG